MKKLLFWILLIFSLIMLLGGFSVITSKGMSIADLVMLIIFITLATFSVLNLVKINKKHHSKKMNDENNVRLQKENNNQKNQPNQNNEELISTQQSTTTNTNPKMVEKELIKEDEFQDLVNNNKNLKKELDAQHAYIKQLENKKSKPPIVKEKIKVVESEESQKNIQKLKDELLNKENYIKQLEKDKQQIKEDYYDKLFSSDTTNSERSTLNTNRVDNLDLTYTKARKISSDFVVLDFETTGLNYKDNEIIQYGIVEFKEGRIINEFTRYFKPDKPVGKTVMRKTGITNEFLADKPKISKQFLEELILLLGGKTIVAHNAPFDMKFLLKNLNDFNIIHEKFRVFDTLTTSRRLIHETPNHKLETLKNYFNLDDGQSHEALNDARATGKLALLLLDRM